MAFPELPDDRRARPRRYRGGDAPERAGRRRAPEDPPPPGPEPGADEQDRPFDTALQHGIAVEGDGEEAEPATRGVRTRHAPDPDAEPVERPRGHRYRNGFEELAGERSGRHGAHGNGSGYAEGRGGTGAHGRPEGSDSLRARYAERLRDARPYEADTPRTTGPRRAEGPAPPSDGRTGGHRRDPGAPDGSDTTGAGRHTPEGAGAHRRGAHDEGAHDQGVHDYGAGPPDGRAARYVAGSDRPGARTGFAGAEAPARSRRGRDAGAARRADEPAAFDPAAFDPAAPLDPPVRDNGRPGRGAPPGGGPTGFHGRPPARGPQAPPPDGPNGFPGGPRARGPQVPPDTPGGYDGAQPPHTRGSQPPSGAPDGHDGTPQRGRSPHASAAGFDGGPPHARGPRAAPPGFDGAPPQGPRAAPDAPGGPPPYVPGPQAPNGSGGPGPRPPRGPQVPPDGYRGPVGPETEPGDGPPPGRPPGPPPGPAPPAPGYRGSGAPAEAGPAGHPRRAPHPADDVEPDEDFPPDTADPDATTRTGRRRRGAGVLPAGEPPGTGEGPGAPDPPDDDLAAEDAPDPRVGKRSGPVGIGERIAAFAGLGRDANGEKRQLSFWKELLLLAGVAILLTVLIQTFLAKVYVIPSGSMETTLHGCTGCTNDRVLVDKVTYNFTDISPGDIVVFRGTDGWASENYTGEGSQNPLLRGLETLGSLVGFAPADEKDFVKRVIAVGGQTVACCDALNQVMVDGQPLEEPYVYYLPEAGPARQIPFGPVTVPEGEYWMMGDSRNNSADSRAAGHGPIPEENIIGKVRLVVLPFDRFGWVSGADPQTTANAAGTPGLPEGLPLALGMMGALPLAIGRRRTLRARAEAERFLPATRRPPGWCRRH